MKEKIKIFFVSLPISAVVVGGILFSPEIYLENEKDNPDIVQFQHSTGEHRNLIVSDIETSSSTPVAIEVLMVKELFVVKEINQNGNFYYLQP